MLSAALLGCPDPHTVDRVRNVRDAATYTAEVSLCVDHAKQVLDRTGDRILALDVYIKCADEVDVRYGVRP